MGNQFFLFLGEKVLEFMAALYNEAPQVGSLIDHVRPYVDRYVFVDDGSTDPTGFALGLSLPRFTAAYYEYIPHTGLPETVKARALTHVNPDSWVVMLDADERFGPNVLPEIKTFIESDMYHDKITKDITHVWFTLQEFIDDQHTRTFQKCRLFRASAAHFSTSVHEDDTFTGNGAFFGWTVLHSKSREKQIRRETEYIATYSKLLSEGKMTADRVRELKGMHYFIK